MASIAFPDALSTARRSPSLTGVAPLSRETTAPALAPTPHNPVSAHERAGISDSRPMALRTASDAMSANPRFRRTAIKTGIKTK
ncbi:MAG: hypothetical protein GX442_00315 [Candidatus Riflebacteria bacterium]|nr:hypothetical protein [Candidatus Riflebacteria bacterium]